MKTIFATIISLLMVGAAFAASDTTVNAGGAYSVAEPYLLSGFGVVFSGLLGWGLSILQTHTNIKVSEQAKASVQQAALNAAGRVLHGLEGQASKISIDTHSALVAKEVPKIIAAIPNDLKKVGMTPEDTATRLQNLIVGKIGQLQQGTVTIPVAKVV